MKPFEVVFSGNHNAEDQSLRSDHSLWHFTHYIGLNVFSPGPSHLFLLNNLSFSAPKSTSIKEDFSDAAKRKCIDNLIDEAYVKNDYR